MDALENDIILHPAWPIFLFGLKPVLVTFNSQDIHVEKGNHGITIPNEDVGDFVTLKKGFIFSKLHFGSPGKTIVARWLSHRYATNITEKIYNRYFQVIADDIVNLSNTIQANFLSRYPRKSTWLDYQEQCLAWAHRFKYIPSKDAVSDEQYEAFVYVAEIATSDEGNLEKIRTSFVNHQLEKYKSYFDTVETNPLTEKQRIACVTDEENNLVLAGAGTGKTSVMIGRAGYLLKANLAKPENILMLAFAKKAAGEMSDRLSEKLGNDSIKASTFHSLGGSIISQVEQGKPSLSKLADDEQLLRKFVDDRFQELMQEKEYKELAVKYFLEYLNEDLDPFEYDTAGEYMKALIDNDIRTLKREKVKSYQESIIANFLLQQGVEYQYEAKYEHETRTIDFRQYQPDFYLPESGVYIEHYGIDKDNRTAPYIDNVAYLESMEWKRALHKEHQTVCIETFHYEHKNGKLLSKLKEKLVNAGVELNPLPDEAVIETIVEQGGFIEFTQLLTSMLGNYKSANLDAQSLQEISTTAHDPARFLAACQLLLPIIEKYEQHLVQNEEIDFNDMINKAIAYLREGLYIPQWNYILIDEFQDISGPRADLIKELLRHIKNYSLFSVGDDWQAIYRFTGSDLSYTTQFQENFGLSEIVNLDKTFRFNNRINEVASRFVKKNPEQINKTFNTLKQVDKPAVSLMRIDHNNENDLISNLEAVFERINSLAGKEASVLILGRYKFLLPDRSEISSFNKQYNNLLISAMSVHASKGKEADYVIVVNMESGKHGFPSEKITHPLLEVLLPKQQHYPHAEERRLFYVALTRAKDRVYLITDLRQPSLFIEELIKESYPIELEEFPVPDSQLIGEQIKCVKCEVGTMVRRTGIYGEFYGCSNFPRCDCVERPCQLCGHPMRRQGRYMICSNKQCDGWLPICPSCGSEMNLRTGPYGEFWGCRNYRSQGSSCSHTENHIMPPSSQDDLNNREKVKEIDFEKYYKNDDIKF